MTSAKTYRSILKFLLDNKKSHCIHPREKANMFILTIIFNTDDIATIIQNSDPFEGHDHGVISILCINYAANLFVFFSFFFSLVSHNKRFLLNEKKANIVPFHKKSEEDFKNSSICIFITHL